MTFFGPDIRNGVPVGLGSTAAFGRRGYSPASLFAQGEAGVWYDPSDLNTLFQDSAGTTPVTAVEQAVGLVLDKSRGLALGPELVTNGDFSNGTTGWAVTGGNGTISVVSGELRLETNTTGILVSSAVTCVVGKTYQLVGTGRRGTYTASAVQFGVGTTSTSTPTELTFSTGTNTTKTAYFVASATTMYVIFRFPSVGTPGQDAFFDNISVREIAGTHRIQPNAASRAILRNRYNQLTYSEQFDNAAWTKTALTVTANSTTGPDGLTTADTLAGDGTNAFHVAVQAGASIDKTYRASFCAKQNTARYAFVQVRNGANGASVIADLQAGTLSTPSNDGTGTNASATIEPIGSGWYRINLFATLTAVAAADARIGITNSASTISLYATTDSIYAVAADLRAANDTVYPYQRIEAATVYDSDTSKFPLYLEYDGSDDSYYTAANLDLSGTDKVTVFAGLTKLSDAAQAAVVELSATIASNNGTFLLAAPDAASATIGWDSKGTTQVDAVASSSVAAPLTAVLTGIGDIGGDSAIIRVNGAVADSETGDQGTGNYGSYALNIGARSSASSPSLRFRGREYQLIVRGVLSSTPDINSTERFIANQKMLRPL